MPGLRGVDGGEDSALIDEGAVPFDDLPFALSPDGGEPDLGTALEGVRGGKNGQTTAGHKTAGFLWVIVDDEGDEIGDLEEIQEGRSLMAGAEQADGALGVPGIQLATNGVSACGEAFGESTNAGEFGGQIGGGDAAGRDAHRHGGKGWFLFRTDHGHQVSADSAGRDTRLYGRRDVRRYGLRVWV